MADAMKPFADGDHALPVGGLTIENGTERVCLSGSLDIARDRRGLDHARTLQGLFAAIVAALEAEGSLPDVAEPSEPLPATRKRNPFK